ncbi:MAG: YqiJ family protein [Tannerella sp.]|jgi:hypothetical protein|nr:YqiJ family protein [Tannerella sp.]
MADFFFNLMHPLPNAVMTVIMAVLAIYWLFTFLLGVGLEVPDLGFDVDADVSDVDVDVPETDADTADSEQDVTSEKSPGFFMKFLNFINIGRVPFMLVLSTFKFFMWIGSLITTSLVNVTSWGLFSLFILAPIAIIAVFFTKFATNPMVKFFRETGYKGEEEIDFLGRSGRMLSTISGEKIGTAEFLIDRNPIKLSVQSMDGSEIKYGDYIVVMDESDDKRKHYLVNKEVSIRNL